ncbi:MAG: hypothetical protein LBD64_08405 [Odoribacteraceae bacterium]|jgi:hypothetical protein|nr:hypothetical protein [Odoribacteraceae bacterium]
MKTILGTFRDFRDASHNAREVSRAIYGLYQNIRSLPGRRQEMHEPMYFNN